MDRLSPNMAPETTAPRQRAMAKPVFSLMPTAMGAKAEMVPTLVPMEVEMKQPMTNSPTTARPPGRRVSPRLTVESTPPAAVAAPVKAPARRKMRHMVMILSSESSSAIRCIFSLNLRPRFWRKATARAIKKTTMAGMA